MIVPGRSREGYVTTFRAKAGSASRDTGAVVVQAINPNRIIPPIAPATTAYRFGILPLLGFMQPFKQPSIEHANRAQPMSAAVGTYEANASQRSNASSV